MKYPLEEKLPYMWLALAVLAIFYGIYFSKMLAQKRHGIRTHQIGRRKEKTLHTIEMLMGIATLGAPAAQLLSIALGWSCLPASARFTGFCIGMLGNLIFLLSVLCMKDSWRAGIPDKDKTELVTTGIYRYSRNPAFLGFDLQYVGVLLMYGNLLTLAFSLFVVGAGVYIPDIAGGHVGNIFGGDAFRKLRIGIVHIIYQSGGQGFVRIEIVILAVKPHGPHFIRRLAAFGGNGSDERRSPGIQFIGGLA
mgnify:CR=1 FL=1